MENKYINRYHTFCKSLENLKKSQMADPHADFVLEGTVLKVKSPTELHKSSHTIGRKMNRM
mgnify:CR=1 FL=1